MNLTSDNEKKPVVIALGYFDSVHVGHREIIKETVALSKKYGAVPTVFTFGGNLRAMLTGEKEKEVYKLEERTRIFKSLGVEEIYVAPVNFNFLSLGKLAFLGKINKKYDIKAYVCGEDYRFGKFGEGSIQDLKKYADGKGQELCVVKPVIKDGKKVSTTDIKKLLKDGNIRKANEILVDKFFITGKVVHGRNVGESLDFPTANLKIDKNKQDVKDGVYSGKVIVDGTPYKAVINYGARPTFEVMERVIEAYLIDYSGDLYDKEVQVVFSEYLREIKKFYTTEELRKQIEEDVRRAKEND